MESTGAHGDAAPPSRVGRSPSTTAAELTHVGLQLFIERGFDAVTVDEIAAAAGIGRRTFFRYFPSKNDLPWGDFDLLLDDLREHLAAVPDEVPLFDALRDAVLTFNRYSEDELPYHRDRMALLFSVPTLAAHGTLRYQAWREVLAEFAGRRLGVDPASLEPQTIAWAFLAAALAGYEAWLKTPDESLTDVLALAIDALRGLPAR